VPTWSVGIRRNFTKTYFKTIHLIWNNAAYILFHIKKGSRSQHQSAWCRLQRPNWVRTGGSHTDYRATAPVVLSWQEISTSGQVTLIWNTLNITTTLAEMTLLTTMEWSTLQHPSNHLLTWDYSALILTCRHAQCQTQQCSDNTIAAAMGSCYQHPRGNVQGDKMWCCKRHACSSDRNVVIMKLKEKHRLILAVQQ
jgi:hypothetical protein